MYTSIRNGFSHNFVIVTRDHNGKKFVVMSEL